MVPAKYALSWSSNLPTGCWVWPSASCFSRWRDNWSMRSAAGRMSCMAAEPLIQVEVAYALPERQCIVLLHVPLGTTARQVVMLVGLARHFPELPPARFYEVALGLFGACLGYLAAHRMR